MINCADFLTINQRRAFILLLLFTGLNLKTSISNCTEPQLRRKLAIGFAYTGGLARYGFLKQWSAEFHYLIGSADSDDGTVRSNVIGARGFRHFRTDKKFQPYAGVGADFINAKSDTIKTSGYMGGAFGGVEYYILPRLTIGLDIGPYYLSLKDKDSSETESGLDFILNTFLNFYIL